MKDLESRLHFLREAERLKNTLRSAHTSSGRTESTAEHSWRLALLVMTFSDQFPDIELLKALKLCIVHDLGEAINGDIPAPEQIAGADKSVDERKDLMQLLAPLPADAQDEFLALYDEYEAGLTPEAQIVKAFDKLETLIQHNQGANPPDFDYAFNLEYGRMQTDKVEIAAAIRAIVDEDTRRRLVEVDATP
ncbi:MAG: HD domain-containing protein [Pseudomonadota bacterium]